MSTDISGLRASNYVAIASLDVSISRWVNERLPAWNEILTSHDVARLTRRHHWTLTALTLVGRFPKKQRFHGRPVGWLRVDIDDWMGRHRHVSGPCSKRRANRPWPIQKVCNLRGRRVA
jgi:predicted DNA-binding transcriptional regulator AlpA